MTIFEYLVLRSQFEEYVNGLEIPEQRKQGTIDNLRWFNKNGHQKNRFRDGFEQAMEIAQTILFASSNQKIQYGIVAWLK